MINILLTGSEGFIGKNLKTYLEDKYKLLCPTSHKLDLCNKTTVDDYFKSNQIDFIIHCANVGGARETDDKATTIEDNLAMVNNLIAAKRDDTRVILFGSGAMYSKDRNLHKVKESEIGAHIPRDLYGISKLEISKLTQKRDDITCLNIFACYGYGEKTNRFPSEAINSALSGENITINQNVIYDYLWVEDMQKIIENFIKNKPKDKIINITPTKSVSLLEIAQIVKDISAQNISIEIKNPNMNNEYTGDNSRLLEEIPDFQFTPINVGLKKLYSYYKNLNLAKV